MTLVKFEDVFDVMTYPAGEPHVEMKTGNRYYHSVESGDSILYNARDFNDLGIMRTANNIFINNGVNVEWVMPYFPFGRHDRRRHRFDGLEIDAASALLAGLNLITIDPHSEVTALFRHHHQAAFIKALRNNTSFEVVNRVFAVPDAGAAKKAYVWAEANGIELVQCLKKRNPETGELSGFQVLGDVEGKDVVVVDDICDGGGTFIGLADELRINGARNLTLAVTHGLFTKGIQSLTYRYNRIYTMDTCDLEHPDLVKVSVEQVLDSGWRI